MVLPYSVSVCRSVCNVCELWLLRLAREINYTTNYSGVMTRHNHKPNNLSPGKVPQFSDEREVGCEKGAMFSRKSKISIWFGRYTAKVTTECGYKLEHSLSTGDVLDEVTRPLSEFKVISNHQFQHLSVIRLTYLLFRVAVFTFRLLYAQPRHNHHLWHWMAYNVLMCR